MRNSILIYPIWHPGKKHYKLIAKKDVFLCATYHKGMDMRGYRAHILEYEEIDEGNGNGEIEKIEKVVCEPSKREPLVIPQQQKGGVLMQSYYKGYSNFWKGRQYVMYVKPK